MITEAEIDALGSRADLRKSGATLQVEVQSPRGALLETVSTEPHSRGSDTMPAENRNAGTRKLVVRLPDKVTKERIEVVFR